MTSFVVFLREPFTLRSQLELLTPPPLPRWRPLSPRGCEPVLSFLPPLNHSPSVGPHLELAPELVLLNIL